jgi:hypothetical protein
VSEPVSLLHLPATIGHVTKVPPLSPRAAAGSTTERDSGSHPAPGRQRLLAERALLQLAWVGLVALSEGYTGPALTPPASGALPPEECAEAVFATLEPDTGQQALSAYRRAKRLSEPRTVRLVDTLA